MIEFERDLYVRVEEPKQKGNPSPLDMGFNALTAYRVLGMAIIRNGSKEDPIFLLSNDHDESLWVSTHHLRTVGISARMKLRLPLREV